MRPSLDSEAEEKQAIIVAMKEAGYKQTDDTKLARQKIAGGTQHGILKCQTLCHAAAAGAFQDRWKDVTFCLLLLGYRQSRVLSFDRGRPHGG